MADLKFHFIKDEITLEIIQTLFDIAGSNFLPPFDASFQPFDASLLNEEDLIQFNLPAGSTIKGMAETSVAESLGSALNSMLAGVAPAMTAFSFILPILGIIKGIIEVLCALMNPRAVIKAVARLFKKWIPPFISLFPPLAGLVLILSIIKAIIAFVLFIILVVIPTIQLIIYNLKILRDAFKAMVLKHGDLNSETVQAGKDKLLAILMEFLNQLGVLALIKPILEIILLILSLVLGFPCRKKKKASKEDKTTADLMNIPPIFDQNETDSTCCDEDVCPPILKSAPSGKGVLFNTRFFNIIPLNGFSLVPLVQYRAKVIEMRKYAQNIQEQLSAQLDGEIDVANPAGYTGMSSFLNIKITNSRSSITKPIVKIEPDGTIILKQGAIVSKGEELLKNFKGSVSFTIEPDFEMLIMHGIISIACHPEIEAIKDALLKRYPDLDISATERFPSLKNVGNDYNSYSNNMNNYAGQMFNIIGPAPPQEPTAGMINAIVPDDTGEIDTVSGRKIDDMIDDAIASMQNIQDSILNESNAYLANLKNVLNTLLEGMGDYINTLFDVDKNIVTANGIDKATITILVKDCTGALIAKGMPDGVEPKVTIQNDFGTIINQKFNSSEGTVTAEIFSTVAGNANITAKINDKFISDFDGTNTTTRVRKVRFVADRVMPKRRAGNVDNNARKTEEDK